MKYCYLIATVLLLTGCAADEPLIPPTELKPLATRADVRLDWNVKVGAQQHAASYFVPARLNDKIYTANSDGSVVALDAVSGKALWRRTLNSRLSSGVAVDEQRVYVAMRDGNLLALDKTDGKTLWRYAMSSEILAPVAAGFNSVVVRSADGRVVGLKADDGTERWRNSYAPPALTLHGYSSPHMLSGGVLLGLDDGKIIALSTDSGKSLWESQLAYPSGRSEVERLVDIDADFVTDSKNIYAVSYQGKLARIEPGKGRQVWAVEFSSVAGIAQTGDQLFVVDDTDMIRSLSKSDGAELWRQEGLVGRKLTRPAVFGDSLIVADFEGFLHEIALDTGELSGRIRVSKKAISASPLVTHDGLIMQSTDGKVSRINRISP